MTMSVFPKDGSTFVVECIDRTAYRWAKYKPQGEKQMGRPGRWQKMVINGDWHRWENCDEPVGEISPPAEDGPITKAFKEAGSLDHWRHEVGKLHSQIATKDEQIGRLEAAINWCIERDDKNGSLPDAYREKLLAAAE
jgi:hypothetical protein